MIQDVKDEILSGEPRYTIRDAIGNVINDDVKIDLKTPLVQEGTPLNRDFFHKIYGMNNYELLKMTQDDISTETTSTVYQQLTDAATGAKWNGYCSNKKDKEMWKFEITSETEGINLIRSSSSSSTTVSCYGVYNGDQSTKMEDINSLLNRGAYNAEYYTMFRSQYTPVIAFKWDLMKECTPTFVSRTNDGGGNAPIAMLQGSNDNSIWEEIGKVANDSGVVRVTPSKAYRYYRLLVTFTGTGSVSSYFQIYFMYFENVPDIINAYRNNFISENDFEVQELKNVIVPPYSNDGYITENNVNGIPIDKILESGTDYKLRRIGDKIILDYANVVTGDFRATSSDTLYTIDVGFKPDLVLIYGTENNDNFVTSATSTAYYDAVPRVLTNSYFSEYGAIVENGFTFQCSKNSVYVYYIALRFLGVKI